MATCRRSIRPPRPAEGHGLAPRVRASLAYLTLFGGLGGLLPFASLYYLARGLDYPQIGALLSLGALLGFVAGPAWGALSDRFGGSPAVLLATATVAVAGLGVLGLAADFGTILAANLLFGLGLAGIFPIVDARAIEAAGTERAGWGPLRAWGSVGWVGSSLATGFAVQAWGLGVIFIVTAMGVAATALLALGLAPGARTAAERPLRAGLRIFRSRTLLVFLVGMLFATAAMSAALDFFTPRFDELGAQAGLIGFSWALAAAIEVPVMLGFPLLSRRFGGTRLLVAGAVIIALRTAVAAVATDPALLVLASGLGGIGYALFTVGGVTYVAEHVPPELAATGQGIFQGASLNLSGVVAAAAGGLLAGQLGIAGMFGVAAVVGFGAAAVVALAVLPGARRRPTQPGRSTGAGATLAT